MLSPTGRCMERQPGRNGGARTSESSAAKADGIARAMAPEVSVIIPVRDRERELPRAMESVLVQSRGDLELLVADDHSVDDSRAVVEQRAASDRRVRLLRVEEGRGAQAARNRGIRAATGRYVAFLDSDDEWLPPLLERCLETLRRTRRLVAYTEGRIMHEGSGQVEPRTGVARLDVAAYRTLLRRPPGPIFSSLVVGREAMLSIGPLDESLVAFQEWDTCLRLAERHGEFALVDEPLFIWHRHCGVTISGDGERNAEGYAQVVEKHREAMVAHVGQIILAVHYGQLARLFQKLGRRRRTWDYRVKAVAAGARSPAVWARVTRDLVGRVAGVGHGHAVQERRVYG